MRPLMTSQTVAVGVLATVLTLFLVADQAAIATPDQYLPADPVLEPGESLVPGQSVASASSVRRSICQSRCRMDF